jgi:hypothetical protein
MYLGLFALEKLSLELCSPPQVALRKFQLSSHSPFSMGKMDFVANLHSKFLPFQMNN